MAAYLGLARGWLNCRAIATLRHAEALLTVRHCCATQPRCPADLPASKRRHRWPILRPDIPFLLGAWGEQTIRACLDEITAIKIGGSANPDVIPHFRRILDFDAATYGVQRMRRETEDAAATQRKVEIVIGAVSVVDEDGAAARRLARREVALYLPVVAGWTDDVDRARLLGKLKEAAATISRGGALISMTCSTALPSPVRPMLAATLSAFRHRRP
jgi:5,10-methylenetetrahydromethanopterin reductase